jgi:glycosyltransferase involved in cell wall biosynthesis
MGSAVKQAEQLSRLHSVHVLTVGRKVILERPNKNLVIESVSGLLLPDPVNYIISLKLLFRFIGIAISYRPDIVLVSKFMFFSSLVVFLARIMGLKVVTVTDTFPGINWFPRSRIVAAVMWLYARTVGLLVLRLSHKVILLYQDLDVIAKKYNLNYEVIPNGVEPVLLEKQRLPSDIKKKNGEFWVGFVGRAESVKGYNIALETAKRLEKIMEIKFIFIGGNQKEITRENKVFLGFRSDIYSIYQLLDCLILPSFSEGLPNVVMESMAQGVPVIGSSVGGVKQLIENGKSGFLVPPGSVEQLAKQIIYLRNHPKSATRMGEFAKSTIDDGFNWDKILIKYQKLFTKICAE